MNVAAPPPASGPRAATAGTVAGHVAVAKLAKLGRDVLTLIGETDPEKALARIAPRLELAAAVLSALGEADPVRAVGVLRARLTADAPPPARRPAPPAARPARASTLSPRDIERARRAGVDPADLEAAVGRLFP